MTHGWGPAASVLDWLLPQEYVRLLVSEREGGDLFLPAILARLAMLGKAGVCTKCCMLSSLLARRAAHVGLERGAARVGRDAVMPLLGEETTGTAAPKQHRTTTADASDIDRRGRHSRNSFANRSWIPIRKQ